MPYSVPMLSPFWLWACLWPEEHRVKPPDSFLLVVFIIPVELEIQGDHGIQSVCN